MLYDTFPFIYVHIYIYITHMSIYIYILHICIYIYIYYICIYIYVYFYTYVYIYIPETSTCAIFCILAKSTKNQPLKIKNVPGSLLEQEQCPCKIIPESYPSSFIPSCDSSATTVGYSWRLLLAPNQRLKSLHDMPVWDEQVARMV